MAQYKEVLDRALKEIIPTTKEIEKYNYIIQKLITLLDKRAKEINIEYRFIEPQGSTGIKQTQLKNASDIDLFIGIDLEPYKDDKLTKSKFKQKVKSAFRELCERWIIKAVEGNEFKNIVLLYAEHPYVSTDYIDSEGKIEIDIVLCFDLTNEYLMEHGPITAVDRTPWHTRFVRDNLSEEQKNHVRLLKQFFKSNYSYGDKSPVGRIGFIGYSAELLIYHYKNLISLFENFNELPKHPIDSFDRPANKLKKINRFVNDFMILIDPTDKNRNVAAAISYKSYVFCKNQVKQFLKTPNISFFQLKPIPFIDLKSLKNEEICQNIFIIECITQNSEVHYTELRDKLYSFGDNIRKKGKIENSKAPRFGKIYFEVFFEADKETYSISFYCENPTISSIYKRRGPPIRNTSHANQFKKKNPEYFEEDNYLCVNETRRYTEFIDFLESNAEKDLPKEFTQINLSDCFNAKTDVGKRCIYVLKEMILPFVQ